MTEQTVYDEGNLAGNVQGNTLGGFRYGDSTRTEEEGATLQGVQTPDGGMTAPQASAPGPVSTNAASPLPGYENGRQMPSTSTEADIYIVEKDGVSYILKLYRYGIEPKRDILQKIKELSQVYPRQFIHVVDVGFDAGQRRWFEVQEYARYGTLQTLMEERAAAPGSDPVTFMRDVAREVGEALNILHQNNLLHLDVKPSNILLRSRDPLDLVLIDFGISTSLDADMSKKFTETRGTPMYQSPESWTGGMGRAADWWGLGMILLEIVARGHPFRGLAYNLIAYTIATQPVAIPEELDEGVKELLRGLLTRKPDNRWSWEQVSRWLGGERGIPQYFESGADTGADALHPGASSSDSVRPFTFMGQACRTLGELAAAFSKDETTWEKGKAFLMRGAIHAWLEQNGAFETDQEMETLLAPIQDPDERTFYFVQQYGQDIPFAFGGHAATLQNLLLIFGKAMNREPLTEMEQGILDRATDGRLMACLDFHINALASRGAAPGPELPVLRAALLKIKNLLPHNAGTFLYFFLYPQMFYCPFVMANPAVIPSPAEVVNASADLEAPPIPMDAWNQMLAKYVPPGELIARTYSAQTYAQALDQLNAMAREKRLLLRAAQSMEEASERSALGAVPMQDYLNGVYRLQWGYDVGTVSRINSMRQDLDRQGKDASGLKKAQIELLSAYLTILAERRIILTLEDRKILQDIRLDSAPAVRSRLNNLADVAPTLALPALRLYKDAMDKTRSEQGGGPVQPFHQRSPSQRQFSQRQRPSELRTSLWDKILPPLALLGIAIICLLLWSKEPWTLSGFLTAARRLQVEVLLPLKRSIGLDPRLVMVAGSAFIAVGTHWQPAWGLLAASLLHWFLV